MITTRLLQETRFVPTSRLSVRVVLLISMIGLDGFSLLPGSGQVAFAQSEYEQAPILYRETEPQNAISRLNTALQSGDVVLKSDGVQGYLPSLLEELQIPVDSQVLVYSKTSLQTARISPRTPRAIYFNDDTYLGYVHRGDVLELSTSDPLLGTVYYTLSQEAGETPEFVRQTDQCLTCHSTSRTENVPGHLVRSLFVDLRGQPIFSAGSRNVDHRTPISQRWGGWYVTGTHGTETHLGNFLTKEREIREPVDNSAGLNLTDVSGRFQSGNYLSPHSDLVALMVLEHQVYMHNKLTRANFSARQALHYQESMSQALGELTTSIQESVERRLRRAAEETVDALLFVEEAEIKEPLTGTSEFANRFGARGPHDAQGRSLFQLQLSGRIFRYPCSFLIYSEAFDALDPRLIDQIWKRFEQVIIHGDESPEYRHLTPELRREILEILIETKPGVPVHWKDSVSSITGQESFESRINKQ